MELALFAAHQPTGNLYHPHQRSSRKARRSMIANDDLPDDVRAALDESLKQLPLERVESEHVRRKFETLLVTKYPCEFSLSRNAFGDYIDQKTDAAYRGWRLARKEQQ